MGILRNSVFALGVVGLFFGQEGLATQKPLTTCSTGQSCFGTIEPLSRGVTLPPGYFFCRGTCFKSKPETVETKPHVSEEVKTAQEKIELTRLKKVDQSDEIDAPSSDDKCGYSKVIGGGNAPGCAGTKIIVEGARVMDQVGQIAGAVAVGAEGQAGAQQAAQSGKVSDALLSAAKTADVTAQKEKYIGTANAVVGLVQLQRKLAHSGAKKDFGKLGTIEKGKDSLTRDGVEGVDFEQKANVKVKDPFSKRGEMEANAVENFNLNEEWEMPDDLMEQLRSPDLTIKGLAQKQYATLIEDKKVRMRRGMKKYGGKAAAEQNELSDMATGGMMMSLTKSAVQFTNMVAAQKTAKRLREDAAKIKGIEGGTGPSAQAPGFDPFPDAPTPNNPGNTITGARAPDTQNSETDDEDTKDEEGGVPPPLPDAPVGGLAGIPLPPGARPAGDKSPAGGGGGGGLGGASTSPSTGQGEAEPTAQYADGKGENTTYSSGGGGGGSRGGGADAGPDLSGLLAQFLPQEKDPNQGNTILDFGNREPASAGEDDGSLLGRDADLFKRVHETYQEKYKKGSVGI